MPMTSPVTLHCDARCGVTISVPRADLDKMPSTWTCPVCQQRQADALAAELEEEWTRANQ